MAPLIVAAGGAGIASVGALVPLAVRAARTLGKRRRQSLEELQRLKRAAQDGILADWRRPGG